MGAAFWRASLAPSTVVLGDSSQGSFTIIYWFDWDAHEPIRVLVEYKNQPATVCFVWSQPPLSTWN